MPDLTKPDWDRAQQKDELADAIQQGGTLIVEDPLAPDDPDRHMRAIIKHAQMVGDGVADVQIELLDGRLYRGLVRNVAQLAGGFVDIEITVP